MKLSLIVPCFNEQQNIRPFFEACKQAFEKKNISYEIIFVNDGSSDSTWEELKALVLIGKNIKIINFSRNFGKEAAMYAGMHRAVGEYVTLIDADLQQRPELVVEMVEFLEQNAMYDCVAAYQEKRNEGKVLSLFKKMFYKIINAICEIDFQSGASDFRTFRNNVAQSILEMKEYFRFSKGIFSWIGYNTHYMPYVAEARNAGKSTWSFVKLMKYAVEGITIFTTFPLKIGIYVGSICSMSSLVYMLVVIIQKLIYGIAIPGYPTLVVLILFLGGVQMILLGIMGQYISQIYIEGKRRPIYITKEYIEGAAGEHDEEN